VIKITPLNQLPTCTGVKCTWNAKNSQYSTKSLHLGNGARQSIS